MGGRLRGDSDGTGKQAIVLRGHRQRMSPEAPIGHEELRASSAVYEERLVERVAPSDGNFGVSFAA